ncbi:replication initiation protein [Pseudomonas aeruginosa]|uniref:replication initiation protein n=1 Tax=Pseudomonas aeruginosa TaxID=287 RepID=UPI000B1B389E|nr:replication initiation protein [Pseudomonas aeruginosa]
MSNIFGRIESSKTVYAQPTYATFAKSILHLPIFQSTKNIDKDKIMSIEIDNLYGYKNVKMEFRPLSVDFDFQVFFYILRLKLKSDRLTFTINMQKFMKDHGVFPSNKKVYIKKIRDSLERMMKFYLEFTYQNKTFKCHILNNVVEDNEKPEDTVITFNKEFENFYAQDDMLVNINIKEYKEIQGDYAKILYMFYVTNKYSGRVGFTIENILKRLNAESFNRKDVLKSIKSAHDELINKKFLKSAEPVKSGKSIAGYTIVFKSKKDDILPDVPLNNGEVPPTNWMGGWDVEPEFYEQ